jgi:GNAT superfamily N-acetyltransferase
MSEILFLDSSMIYQVRNLTPQEMDIPLDWAATEGWNPGLFDADSFYAADPAGFFLGVLDGVPIATLSAVRYGNDFGFLGFYIVKPEYRHQGYGLQLWQAVLQHLEHCTIGLDGVLDQQDNYKRSGFSLAHRNIRYQGVGTGHHTTAGKIVPLSRFSFAEINAYDRHIFGYERSRFLEHWIHQPQSTALGVLQDGKLAGYGVLRRCRNGYKIGPLFADQPDFAELLFTALQRNAEANAPLFLDTPEINPFAVALAERSGMTRVFETARMYRGSNPDVPLHRVFGVTSLELG